MGRTAIILVNYNSYSDTLACVASLLHMNDHAFQVFIVDNSSNKSGQQEFIGDLKKNISDVSVESDRTTVQAMDEHEFQLKCTDALICVISAQNRGFAAANNLVLRQLAENKSYDFVWMLNNDTIVQQDSLKKYKYSFAIESAARKLGLFGCVLVYLEKPDTIQGVGGTYHAFLGTSSHVFDGNSYAPGTLISNASIDYPIGASMFCPVAYLREVGLMDESFFLYFEEFDWVKRGKEKGWECGYAADVVIAHRAGASIGGKTTVRKKSSHLSDYYFYRNRIIFAYRYTPFHLPFVLGTIAATIGYRLLTGRGGFLQLFFKYGFKGLQ